MSVDSVSDTLNLHFIHSMSAHDLSFLTKISVYLGFLADSILYYNIILGTQTLIQKKWEVWLARLDSITSLTESCWKNPGTLIYHAHSNSGKRPLLILCISVNYTMLCNQYAYVYT